MPEDPENFDRFFLREFGALVVFVRRLGLGLDAAKSTAAQAMSQACRHWDQLTHPLAWVRVAAHRISVHRGEDRAHEDLRALALLACLSAEQREVLTWYLDGFDTNEIARHLGISETRVRATRQLDVHGVLVAADQALAADTAAGLDVEAALAAVVPRQAPPPAPAPPPSMEDAPTDRLPIYEAILAQWFDAPDTGNLPQPIRWPPEDDLFTDPAAPLTESTPTRTASVVRERMTSFHSGMWRARRMINDAYTQERGRHHLWPT